jgi:hypothetical protein
MRTTEGSRKVLCARTLLLQAAEAHKTLLLAYGKLQQQQQRLMS